MSDKNNSDHDLLIELKADVKNLTDLVKSHIRHHFTFNIMVGGALLTGLFSLIVMIIS